MGGERARARVRAKAREEVISNYRGSGNVEQRRQTNRRTSIILLCDTSKSPPDEDMWTLSDKTHDPSSCRPT